MPLFDMDNAKRETHILKGDLRENFIKAIEDEKNYSVIYEVEVTAFFEGEWKEIPPRIIELRSELNEEGYTWAWNPSPLWNTIDSLGDTKRIFRVSEGHLKKSEILENKYRISRNLIYVSKPEANLPKKGHRRHYAKKIQNQCMIRDAKKNRNHPSTDSLIQTR